MSETTALHPDISSAVQALSTDGGHLLPAEEFSRILGATPADWQRFGRNWEHLELDTYMADGGTYRRRRYGQYDLDALTGALTPLPHGPYRQESYINALNGGVDRIFEPLTEAFAGDPLLTEVLVTLGRIFGAVEGTERWNIKLHPYRITAGAELGQPAPEGRHRDGVTFITALLIDRRNVDGGESSVYNDAGEVLLTTTLSEPGDILLGDDRSTLHSVTPIHPVDQLAPAHRDVLVIAYTAR